MLTIMPMKSAFQQGTMMIKGRIGTVRLSTPMHLRNRTAVLFNRRFSKAFSRNDIRKSGGSEMVKKAKAAASKSNKNYIYNQNVPMKWALITGVTLVIGTILLVSRHDTEDSNLDHDSDKNRKKRHSAVYRRVKIFNNNWAFFCYSTLPLNAMSRLWGQVNSLTLPMWLRPIGFNFYSYLFGVNIDEMVDPDLYHYANLSEFFYRQIRPEVRPIAMGDNVIASPSDGQILQIGIINSETGEIEQVKGLTYSVQEFLGTHAHPMMTKSDSNLSQLTDVTEEEKLARLYKLNRSQSNLSTQTDVSSEVSISDVSSDASTHLINFEDEGDKTVQYSKNSPTTTKTIKLLNELTVNIPSYRSFKTDPSKNIELFFAVIYLSPGDYHHYHSPVDWVCKLRRHFPGDLFSVAPYFQNNFPNLFVLNERVPLLGYWKYGFFSMTPVGATNVGSIRLNFDEKLVTNVKRRKHLAPHTCYEATYKNASKLLGGMPLEKGEEMGGFKLGSTVVLCFEAPSDFKFNVSRGDKVKVGQKLGAVQDDSSD